METEDLLAQCSVCNIKWLLLVGFQQGPLFSLSGLGSHDFVEVPPLNVGYYHNVVDQVVLFPIIDASILLIHSFFLLLFFLKFSNTSSNSPHIQQGMLKCMPNRLEITTSIPILPKDFTTWKIIATIAWQT